MKWKRMTAVVTALSVIASLTACSQGASAPSSAPETAPSTAAQTSSATPETTEIRYEDTIAWDTEYDVVVVGFGGAGAVSSIAAAEEGAKVLLTEKAPEGHEGGNTRYCAQVMLNYDDYDSGMAYVKEANDGYDNMTEDIMDFIVKGSMENPAWMESVGLTPATYAYALGEYPEFPNADKVPVFTVKDDSIVSGKTYWETVRKGVIDRVDNIDVWFESPAEHLIQDPISKTILGVQIQHGGKSLNVRANNGVVLACGGFENNEEMVENYTQRERMYPLGSTYNTGDGINMVLEVGADLWHMNALSGPWITIKTDDMDRAYFNSMKENISNNGACIYVGKNGMRFMNESGWHRHGHTSVSGSFYSQMTPYPMYAIFDQSAMDAGLDFPPSFSSDLQAEIDAGIIVKADSIAELAEKIGVNVDEPNPNVAEPRGGFDLSYINAGLVPQVERYNRYCAAGVDEQFDRHPDTLNPIAQAPFYAIEIQPAMVNTQGGAKRNLECEILNPSGEPIPHLYGAGEFGSFYGGAYTGGGNIAETVFSGRVAGRNAAAVKEESQPIVLTAVESTLQDFGSDAIKDNSDISLTDGETLGTATGMGGDLTVKVKRDGDKIVSVEVISQSETVGIGDKAFEQIPGMIVEANSPDVDAISGATITSKAIMEAVKDAISK